MPTTQTRAPPGACRAAHFPEVAPATSACPRLGNSLHLPQETACTLGPGSDRVCFLPLSPPPAFGVTLPTRVHKLTDPPRQCQVGELEIVAEAVLRSGNTLPSTYAHTNMRTLVHARTCHTLACTHASMCTHIHVHNLAYPDT